MEYPQLEIAKSDDGTCKRVIGNNFMITLYLEGDNDGLLKGNGR